MDKRKRRLLCMLEGSGRKSRWISGVPPLQYSAKKQGTLKNYRIYGNTVGGAGVGDLVENGEHAGEYEVPVTVEGKNLLYELPDTREVSGITFTNVNNEYVYIIGESTANYAQTLPKIIHLKSGTYYIKWYIENISYNSNLVVVLRKNNNTQVIANIFADGSAISLEEDMDCWLIVSLIQTGIAINTKMYIQIEKGSTATPYEPYQAPVTTNLYLPEQIKMVGNEAEYVDYAEQKMHRIGADDIDVTLPALPTLPETNVLSVGTAVQPSKIEVKGKIKAI